MAAAFAFPAAAVSNADFSYSVDASDPMTIHFTDKSSGAGNWFWTFNDGGAISNERNPTHTFSSEGEYRVTLVASDSDYGNEDTEMKWITITRSGVTEDNGGSLSGSGGINLPSISLGGISIPKPFGLISEYIKLIKVMVILSNYQNIITFFKNRNPAKKKIL